MTRAQIYTHLASRTTDLRIYLGGNQRETDRAKAAKKAAANKTKPKESSASLAKRKEACVAYLFSVHQMLIADPATPRPCALNRRRRKRRRPQRLQVAANNNTPGPGHHPTSPSPSTSRSLYSFSLWTSRQSHLRLIDDSDSYCCCIAVFLLVKSISVCSLLLPVSLIKIQRSRF